MAAQFSTLGALIGLAIAIVLIIRKVAPAYCLILGALVGGLIGGEARRMKLKREAKGAVCGEIAAKAASYAMGVLEVNASMGLIVAAPTAGSSGVIPGVLCAVQETYGFSDDEMVMALRKGLVQPFDDIFQRHNGANLQQTAEDNHVEALGVTTLGSSVHRTNLIDVDICAFRGYRDAVAIVDESAAGLDL